MNEATASDPAKENVAVQGCLDGQSDPTSSPRDRRLAAGEACGPRRVSSRQPAGHQPNSLSSRRATLSARTVVWLAEHHDAGEVVSSVWTTLTALERAGQHPGALAALRFVLIHHQPPTRTGCCPACRRHSWHHLWRRRRFPCVVWRQIRGELLGHLASVGTPPLSTEHIIAQLQQLRELLPTPVGDSHD